MPEGHIRFSTLLEHHLNRVIQKKFPNPVVTPDLMRQVREEIRAQISLVFQQSNHKISAETTTWLTDQYFKVIKVGDDQKMGDLVIIHEYKLEQLPYHDVELLRNLYNQTALRGVLDEEYQRRSQS